MRIFVCIKEIQNPELPNELFSVDEGRGEVIPVRHMPLVTSPMDEQAVEAALRLRDQGCNATITVLTFGPSTALAGLKRALSMGADAGVLVSNVGLEKLDSVATAAVLCQAIRKSAPFDLILTGRQAADWDAGIVGCGIGEMLGIPVVAYAKGVKSEGGRVLVERVLDDGCETVETSTPCVVTIANELGEPRKPSLRETMRAAKKPIVTHNAAALGSLPPEEPRLTRDRLFVPVRDRQCEMFTGTSARDIAARIAARLREAKHLP